MNYISNTSKKNKKNKGTISIIAIIILIVSALYIFTKIEIPGVSNVSGSIVYGVNNVCKASVGFIKNGTSYFDDVKSLQKENLALKVKINNLEYSLIDKNSLLVQNQDLKDMLEIKDGYNQLNLKFANIILRDYNNWDEQFSINIGTKDGIKYKDAVITKDGLVGYISKITKDTSIVTTILSPSSSVSAIISSVNELALIKGDFNLKQDGKLKLQYIQIDTSLSEGETIYTSGIGELYKKGIPIGKLTKIVNKKNQTDRYGLVTPFVNFDSINIVAIITN